MINHYYCTVYDECKYSDTFWLADRTRLFVQYTISLSSLCKLIWRHWAYKMLVRYILSSVWVRLSIFSPLSIIQYVGLYVFSLSISLVMNERIYILCLIIIIKSEAWTITHCLGLGHETMVSAVCLSISLWTWFALCRKLIWFGAGPYYSYPSPWWRHQMETFSALLALCAGNSPVTGEFPAQRPVAQSFDVFFDLRLNKRLSKQWWGWWFETPWGSLWRHCNANDGNPELYE